MSEIYSEQALEIEDEKIVDRGWLFDVDGVLTHPVEKRVTEERLIDAIVEMLKKGEPVALNTGRSADFMIERVLGKIEDKVEDKKLLQNILAVGEKGSAWISYDEVGKRSEVIDESVSVPLDVQEEVKKLLEEKFSNSMFYDATKRTMVSVEMIDGYDWSKFKEDQVKLDTLLLQILTKKDLLDTFKIDPSRIATDIENKYVGKALGARRFTDWLKVKKIKAKSFVAFGDSKSDISMAHEISAQGSPVEFVFVGEKDLLAGNDFPFAVHYTEGKCEKGTLEYLDNLQ